MEIKKIYSYLVYPGKHVENPEVVRGTELELNGKLFLSLKKIFDVSSQECDIPIRFVVNDEDDQKQNAVRTFIIDFLKNPNVKNGEKLAIRLRDFTTNVPGIGLLFIILGKENQSYKLVLSRFPADEGILANTDKNNLTIEFIERIFLKNSVSYKAASYFGQSFDSDFWFGMAIDKQNNNGGEISIYWIKDFLKSDYKTTSKAGTNRFGNALREAIKNTRDLETKQELVGASLVLLGFSGKSYSINKIVNMLNISDNAKQELFSQLPQNSSLLNDVFTLDKEEFVSCVPQRSVELSNGAIIIGPMNEFESIISKELIDSLENIYRFSSEGQIVNEKLRRKQ